MKYLFFLLLPLAYLAGNVYLFFRGKAAFAAQSTGVKVLLLIIFLCCALAFFGAFFLRELHLPATMAQRRPPQQDFILRKSFLSL